MNCPNCGTVLPLGAQSCAVCGTFIPGVQDYSVPTIPPNPYAQGFDPSAYPQGGYGQGYTQPSYHQPSYATQGYPQGGYVPGFDTQSYNQTAYMQGFDPSAQGQGYEGYGQGYQPAYGRYNPAMGEHGAFVNTLGYLPRVITSMFRDPGETLQGMMERNDLYTGGVIAGLTLLLTFFTGMILTRSAVSSLFSTLSGLFGAAVTGDAASVSQGVNYIAGKISVSIGGIMALSQLFAMLIPTAVALVYLCAVRKVRFSFLLASNLLALITIPSVPALILCIVGSLVSPLLGLLFVLAGLVASYVLLSGLVARITGLPEPNAAPTKIAIICLSEILKIVFIFLIGGALLGQTINTVTGLITSMGSLL